VTLAERITFTNYKCIRFNIALGLNLFCAGSRVTDAPVIQFPAFLASVLCDGE